MPNKFARSNGDFNNASIWSGLAASMSATSVPTIGDNAIANNFVVQITGTVACDNITNGTTYGGTAGGTFNLGNGSQVTSNIITQASVGTSTTVLTGANNASFVGNIAGIGGGGGVGLLVNSGSGNLTILGSTTTGGTGTGAIVNSSTGRIDFTGSLLGTSSRGLDNTSTGSVNVVGNVVGSNQVALANASTGSITVLGNVISDSRGGAGIGSTNAAANVKISGNIINAPNGIPAVYAAAYTVNPIPSQTYIRYANNGTGVGSDAYLYHYTTDSLSAFSMPPVSAVRAGLQYANNTLTGTCQIPSVSSVAFGTLVDNTTGTAVLTSNNLWETSITSLTANDSLGARLKNSATVESVGRILASFTN
jgi:fibronectin-binding autotransporter adhesin